MPPHHPKQTETQTDEYQLYKREFRLKRKEGRIVDYQMDVNGDYHQDDRDAPRDSNVICNHTSCGREFSTSYQQPLMRHGCMDIAINPVPIGVHDVPFHEAIRWDSTPPAASKSHPIM